mmetsp:Transcript_20329/g.48111  ORF Transcript_20329/g.48111 Transcript_20329/m.48111 type:complete len:162 (+) Transcript_20329:2-487(+)
MNLWGGGIGGLAGCSCALRGTLLKRPSKVHILHNLELEPPWVGRNFALLPAERLLVYVQHAPDSIAEPQGILPLSNYASIEEINVPHSSGFFAFQLCPPPASSPSQSTHSLTSSYASILDTDAQREGATECFVLLAETAEKRREWVSQIRALLPTTSRVSS